MVQESPTEALKLRFAKGEITHEQYKDMLSVLLSPSSSSGGAVTPPTPPAVQNQLPLAPQPLSSYKDSAHSMPLSPRAAAAAFQGHAPFTYSSNNLLIVLALAMIPAIFLFPLSFLIVIACAVAVYYDAEALGAGGGQKETLNSLTWSPFSWAALVLLLWIIGMPLYLIRRKEIFDQALSTEFPVNQESGGIGKIVVLLILGVVGVMFLVIISAVIAAFVFGMGSNV